MDVDQMNKWGINHVNGWLYGNLIANDGDPYIASDHIPLLSDEDNIRRWFEMPVYKDSVGQYIGREDVKGKDVYEGDNVQFYGLLNAVGVISYDQKMSCFVARNGSDVWLIRNQTGTYFEVIGNIFENPDI